MRRIRQHGTGNRQRWVAAALKSFIFLLFIVSAFSSVHAGPEYPKASGYVNDFAGALDAGTAAEIKKVAEDLEAQTSDELAVVTVKSVAPMALKDYAVELFKRWGIGKKKKDNGVLLIVAVEDHRVEIEVGYGLEGVLTDGKCGEILDTYVVPRFKEKDVARGMLDGAKAIAATLTGGAMPGEEKILAEMPAQKGSINDFAGVLSENARTQLAQMSKDLETKSSASLVVVTVKSKGSMKAADYAHRLYDKWGMEKKYKGRGVIFLAVDDGAWFAMYVGDDLFKKKIINGTVITGLLNDYVIPYYNGAGFNEGMLAGARAISATITGDKTALPQKIKETQEQTSPPSNDFTESPLFVGLIVGGVIGGIALLIFLVLYFSKPKCPKCKRRKFVKDTSHHVILKATYSHSGSEDVTYYCKACDYTWTRHESIPQKTTSSSSSSSWSSHSSWSGGGGSSFGGFGGGSSGGGGAGRSW